MVYGQGLGHIVDFKFDEIIIIHHPKRCISMLSMQRFISQVGGSKIFGCALRSLWWFSGANAWSQLHGGRPDRCTELATRWLCRWFWGCEEGFANDLPKAGNSESCRNKLGRLEEKCSMRSNIDMRLFVLWRYSCSMQQTKSWVRSEAVQKSIPPG